MSQLDRRHKYTYVLNHYPCPFHYDYKKYYIDDIICDVGLEIKGTHKHSPFYSWRHPIPLWTDQKYIKTHIARLLERIMCIRLGIDPLELDRPKRIKECGRTLTFYEHVPLRYCHIDDMVYLNGSFEIA